MSRKQVDGLVGDGSKQQKDNNFSQLRQFKKLEMKNGE